MGGFFGAVSKHDAIADVFFGTDYHSHLVTRRGGLAAYNTEVGLQREIHNIQNSPFRTKFEDVFDEMSGFGAIGCISDTDPQPLLIRSRICKYAICIIGRINNADELIEKYPNYKSYVPKVTEEIVRDVIAKLNMKVKSQVIVDLVVGRYSLIEKQ